MSNYSNDGSTMLEASMPPGLSGASPTSYFCGNLIWRTFMQTKETVKSASPATTKATSVPVQHIENGNYSQLHLLACLGNVTSASSFLDRCPSEEINKQDNKGNTALHWAALQGQQELIQLLIDNNANVNAQNFVGETALILAASHGFDSVVSVLLENGANPNIANLDGATAVHFSAAAGNSAALELMARYGAFVNCQDDCGDSPLHYAIREGQLKVVEQLVTRLNANVDLCNEEQESPLELAWCLRNERDDLYDTVVQFLSQFSNGSFKMDAEELAWN